MNLPIKIKKKYCSVILCNIIIKIILNIQFLLQCNKKHAQLILCQKGKTITIRVSEDTVEEIKGVCSNLGDSYNFNQFVNQSLSAILEVINHDGESVPIPKFAMMARLMRNYEESVFENGGMNNGGKG